MYTLEKSIGKILNTYDVALEQLMKYAKDYLGMLSNEEFNALIIKKTTDDKVTNMKNRNTSLINDISKDDILKDYEDLGKLVHGNFGSLRSEKNILKTIKMFSAKMVISNRMSKKYKALGNETEKNGI